MTNHVDKQCGKDKEFQSLIKVVQVSIKLFVEPIYKQGKAI